MDALRSDLALYLGFESGDPRAPPSPDVSINRLNGHIIVKVGSGVPRMPCHLIHMAKGIALHYTNAYHRAGENRRSSSSLLSAASKLKVLSFLFLLFPLQPRLFYLTIRLSPKMKQAKKSQKRYT